MKICINTKALLRRLMIIPVLLFGQTVMAQVPDADVELPGGIVTLRQALDIVEKQGKILFGYDTQDIDLTQRLELPKGIFPLGTTLNMLFVGTEYKYTVSGEHIYLSLRQIPSELGAENFTSEKFEPHRVKLPSLALKTNLLYGLTTTLNLGIEIGLGRRWTLDVPFNYNPWVFSDDTRLRHWGVQPELRYWFCQRFDGWFMGAHGHYAKFNIGGWPDWSFISETMQHNRYQGHLYGGGISLGYSWLLGKRWSMEATLGAGYAHIVMDKYPCAECGTSQGRRTKDYFGPTKAGVSLVYIIK